MYRDYTEHICARTWIGSAEPSSPTRKAPIRAVATLVGVKKAVRVHVYAYMPLDVNISEVGLFFVPGGMRRGVQGSD